MIDKRKHFTMEEGYCYSDFDFYKNREGTTEVGRVVFDKIASRAGSELWALVDTYSFKGKWVTTNVLVLQNKAGAQIEVAEFGWKRYYTEHDDSLVEKAAYKRFLTALQEAGKLAPNGASRWFNEAVLENFENTFEEILYYGEEDA